MISDGEKYNFYTYLIDNGYLFDYSLIENFLLSFKSNPFIVLIGGSGCGKSILPILFAKYMSEYGEKEDIILHSVNSLGKSYSNKEWHLKRDVIEEILPILPFEGKNCTFTINDSFTSYGYFKIDPRFKFKDRKLINHLLELQKENPNQDLNLKIKVGEKFTEAKYLKINDFKNKSFLSDERDYVDNNDSNIFKFLNDSKEHPNINYFLIVEDIEKRIEKNFVKFLDYINEEYLEKKDYNNLFIIGNVNVNDFNTISDSLLDRVSFIEFEKFNIDKYLFDTLNKTPEIKDIDYLEFNNGDVLKLSIFDIKSIFKEIYCNELNLWNLISNELILINNIFLKEGLSLNFRIINDILRFMLVSWKYEGKRYNWDNWEQYFDIQFKQKILSKINNLQVSSNFLSELLALCLKSHKNEINEENIKYKNTYLKIKNIEENFDSNRCLFFKSNGVIKDISKNSLKISNSKKNSKKSLEKNTSKYGSNIYKLGDYFNINKQINRKHVNFGKFESLDDAKFVKNILVENDWKLSRIRNNDCIYQNEDSYWVIKVLNNKLNILGKFFTYDQAEEHLGWLIAEYKNNDNFEIYIPEKAEKFYLDEKEFQKVTDSLFGWKKLVFNAINEIKGSIFSLDDLKKLDMFEMYQFEDQSLDSIIKRNLDELVDLKLAENMGNNYYKKLF